MLMMMTEKKQSQPLDAQQRLSLMELLKAQDVANKGYVCPMRSCGRRFSTPGNLSRHKRLHGPIKPLECPVDGCICTFRSENKLAKHMKFHLGITVHICSAPACGKTFSTAGNLNRHIKGHHSSQNDDTMSVSSVSSSDAYDSSTGTDDKLLLQTQLNNQLWKQMEEATTASGSVLVDSERLDDFVSILDEVIVPQTSEAPVVNNSKVEPIPFDPMPCTILDDMVRFHINNFATDV